MALTIQQAQAAGALAQQATQLQGYVAELQAALGANAILESITCIANVGAPLTAALPLSQADTATLLNAALTIYQGMLANVTAQLAAMGS